MDRRPQVQAHRYAAPPPPPLSLHVDGRAVPPPQYLQHQYQQSPSTAAPQTPLHHSPYPGAPGPGPSLPPIQQPYGPPPSTQDQPNLPSFRHPSQNPPPLESREGQDYHHYNHPNRSEHATPAPINRSYSHDSAYHQRTPTTPSQPGPYPTNPAPDGAHPAPQPHHMDHGPHHGYPTVNGVHHGLPPPQGHPPHHEQHPQYMMDTHHAYSVPPQQQMYQQPYPPTSGLFNSVQKRKNMRATQACEQCRQRKQKCDEGSPCSFCKENNLQCQYRDTPPAKTDKNMEKLLGYMEAHASGLQQVTSKLDAFDSRLRRMEHGANAITELESQPAPQDEPARRKPELDDHRTAPHKLLLLWPSVYSLLKAADVNVNESYVMEAEDRGILRLYTRGEGIDEHDGTQPGGPASPATSDEAGEGNTPTPPEGLWGTGFPYTPSSDSRRSDPSTWGGLKSDGSLDLDPSTVDALYDSYIQHFHVMHPFLDKYRLRKLLNTFIKRYSIPSQAVKFAVPSNTSDSERPLKRQRSNGSTYATAPGVESGVFRSQSTERSPGNAIVYLVLALGKISMHVRPLPRVVPDSRLNANAAVNHSLSGGHGLVGSSPMSTSIKPSPISPSTTPGTTQPTPPTTESTIPLYPRSRRSSGEGVPRAGARNLDVIPGLAYYAKAAEILGDQGDGNDLVHAQMFLLAALYKGQLARVKESMSWITMAGRAILNLLDRYKLYNDNYWTAFGDIRKKIEKSQSLIKDKRDSLIVLASWTCLQLESDILAELRLPSSGIQDLENLLLMPHKIPEDEQSYDDLHSGGRSENNDHVLLFYTAQMFLRKRLNQVHREMYGPDCLSQALEQVRETLKGHEFILGAWRDGLPPLLRWNDDDPPATDILAARLRAKYWGARYVVNRPFLDYALHIMPLVKDGQRVQQVARDVHGNPRDKAEIHLFQAIEGMGEPEIWQASKRCIDAAMQSTVALDGVPGRPVVTNIHGTAHAQFGNMLVLSATYFNRYLNTLVPKERFQGLLERTIMFLRRLGPISPTCTLDCSILEKIQKCLFGIPPDAKHIYRNEGIEALSAGNSFSAST